MTGKPVREPHDSTGEPGAGNRPAGFGERGEETYPRDSACGPIAKAPDKPPTPYRLRASPRLYFAPYWQSIQRALFPQLEPVLGPLTGKQQQLVQTLEVIRIEQWIPRCFRVPGRPRKDRAALARAFVAKAVYDMPTTRVLLERLVTDVALRRICGWERKSEVPSESVFSRAFAEFSDTQLPQRTHAALIRNTHHDRLVGHLCRDSTAIEAREKPAAKEKTPVFV